MATVNDNILGYLVECNAEVNAEETCMSLNSDLKERHMYLYVSLVHSRQLGLW